MPIEAIAVVSGFWRFIGHAKQSTRLHGRRADPLKLRKLSPIQNAAMAAWDAYAATRDRMSAVIHNGTPSRLVVDDGCGGRRNAFDTEIERAS